MTIDWNTWDADLVELNLNLQGLKWYGMVWYGIQQEFKCFQFDLVD